MPLRTAHDLTNVSAIPDFDDVRFLTSWGCWHGVDDGGVDSTACGGRGGQGEAAPRGGMVEGVEMKRPREGRRLLTMGGDGGERRVRPRQQERKNYGWPLLPLFRVLL